MNVLDLFSGIGGFSLGLERAGMRTVAFCEIEPFCRAVLRKHWPGVPIFEDVRTLTAADVPGVDVICGGFPCQPYSIAGKRLGNADDRALWPQYFRLVKECRPAWVIGENVPGIVDLALDGVLADLEGVGYSTRTFDIPACAVGLPTLERHIWIIASANGKRLERSKQETLPRESCFAWEFQGGDTGESIRWQLPESRVCGEHQRIPHRLDRLKSLGNAVVPQIPEIIGRAIMQAERIAA